MIETAIIVLHYENEELTEQCISSILEHTEKDTYQIIIVDNNSPTVYKRKKALPNIKVIRNDDRSCVSGMNFGFFHALYQMPYKLKYIVNFDNDIICFNNWLPPLIDVMERNHKCGIVGGKQWNKDKTKFSCVGADLMGMLHRNLPEKECAVLWIQGSFHMYRADMMKAIGLHDTRYKTICSDSDYCIHAVDRGYQVIFTPESEVIHIGNASYGAAGYEDVQHDNAQEDKIKFMQKWLGVKFCHLFKEGFKFDLSNSMNIEVVYKFNDISRTYYVNGVVTRYATNIASKLFKDKEIEAVEVGSLMGLNAESILRNLNINKLTLVDNNEEGFIDILKDKFKDFETVEILESDSKDAASKFEDNSLDFVYIDADHSYIAVKSDIEAWYPKVKSGGIISGHDYYEQEEFGVIQAVNEFFENNDIHTNNIDWLVYKK